PPFRKILADFPKVRQRVKNYRNSENKLPKLKTQFIGLYYLYFDIDDYPFSKSIKS
ncbi:MAG: hypothetical protein ACJAV5_002312, partial [Vicingaceae bacterium]